MKTYTDAQLIRDPARWDALVQEHETGGFLQSAAWGLFKRHFGWAPVRLALPPARGSVRPVAQVLFRRLPYSPYTLGYIPRGPLLDYEDEEVLDRMTSVLNQVAHRYRAIAITWELPIAAGGTAEARLARRGLRSVPVLQAQSTRLIDLSPSLEAIAASQKPKWRYNTRVAQKHGVVVRPAASVEDLARWYALLVITARRDGFVARGEDYYRRFWQENYDAGDTRLLLAEHDGTLLAGIMVHRFGAEATYLYGASSEEGRNLMPNFLLQWEAIRWAKERGAAQYDMFGVPSSDDPNEPLAGVGRFKAGFGGTVVRFAGAFDRVYHPLLYRAAQRARAAGGG